MKREEFVQALAELALEDTSLVHPYPLKEDDDIKVLKDFIEEHFEEIIEEVGMEEELDGGDGLTDALITYDPFNRF